MAMLNCQRVYDVIRTIISCGFSRVPRSEDARLVLKCYNLATCEATKKRAAWKPHMKTHGLWKMILNWLYIYIHIYIYVDTIRLYQVLWSSSAYLSLKKNTQLLEIQTAKIICKNKQLISKVATIAVLNFRCFLRAPKPLLQLQWLRHLAAWGVSNSRREASKVGELPSGYDWHSHGKSLINGGF